MTASHDEWCERIDVDIGVGAIQSPCGCEVRALRAGVERLETKVEELSVSLLDSRTAAAGNRQRAEAAEARAAAAEKELADYKRDAERKLEIALDCLKDTDKWCWQMAYRKRGDVITAALSKIAAMSGEYDPRPPFSNGKG